MRTFLPRCLSACLLLIACGGSHDDGLGTQRLRDAGPDEEDAAGAEQDAALDPLDGSPAEDAALTPDQDAGDEAGADAAEEDAGADAGDAESARIQAYVNADTGDDTNDGSSAAPLKTLARAFDVVGENGLVWLQPSTFTDATEGLMDLAAAQGRSVPSGTHLRATASGVLVGVTVVFPAGGRLEGVTFDTAARGRVLMRGGEVVLEKLVFTRARTNNSQPFVIETYGSARVTLSAGGDETHNYIGEPGSLTALAMLREQSELTIDGGRIDGASGAGLGNLIDVGDATKLTLRNVTISNDTNSWVSGGSAIWMGGPRTAVTIENSRIDLNDAGGAACVVQDDNSGVAADVDADLTVRDSVLTRCLGGALHLREGAPRVRIEDSELSESGRFGIECGRIGFDGVRVAGAPLVTLIDSRIHDNAWGGIAMNAGGSLSIEGTSIENNGTPAAPRGGIWLEGAFPYALRMRRVSVISNTGASASAGVHVMGDASSTFDLGTAASSGNNTLATNTTTQLHVQVAAGALVSAVGNTWPASAQGTEIDGSYRVAGALCAGADPCDQTSGEGTVFSFAGAGAGARLRLAD
jgi:Right handed beta helix region